MSNNIVVDLKHLPQMCSRIPGTECRKLSELALFVRLIIASANILDG
jgi:hypothetical protein